MNGLNHYVNYALVTIRLILTSLFVLITPTANALDSVSLNVGTITSAQWKLEGINIALADLPKNPQKLALTIAKLSLPKPFDDLNLVNIRCTSFTWQNKEMSCEQGRAEIHSKRWQSPAANFSFHVTEKYSSFKLSDLHLADGIVTVDGEERSDQWQLQIDVKAVDGKLIQQLLPQDRFKLKGGKINLKLNAFGSHALVKEFTLTTGLNSLTGQTQDGRFAAEALMLKTTLSAQNHKGIWQWQNHIDINGGALYTEPLYLEAAGQNMIWDAQGNWDAANSRVEINVAKYTHSKVGELSGSASIQYADGVSLEKAQLSLSSDNLKDISANYLKPFLEQTVLQGVTLAGHLKADFSIDHQVLTALTAVFNNLDVKDAAGRGEIQGGAGRLNWSNNELFSQPSNIAWQRLQ
ncbi:MAG: C4-dicarboxylate ABC transporter, partial [Methylobacter sp.]